MSKQKAMNPKTEQQAASTENDNKPAETGPTAGLTARATRFYLWHPTTTLAKLATH